MDNDAFKNLVRTRATTSSAAGSSKAIARKAVEDEFKLRHKKKRKRGGGGGYASSSDEDDETDRANSKTAYKRSHPDSNQTAKDNDDVEAIQKDLSSRYRDRAKERREGKPSTTTTATADGESGGGSSEHNNHEKDNKNNLWIIPHNIKGLDIALARKERKELLQKKSTAAAAATTSDPGTEHANNNNNNSVPSNNTRMELPSKDEAHRILREFVSSASGTGKSNNDSSNNNNNNNDTTLRKPLVDYLEELLRWKTLDVAAWDGGGDDDADSTTTTTRGASAARRTLQLQRTRYALAIDGNPMDAARAWEHPREYTLSGGGSFGRLSSSAADLSVRTLRRIDAVFRYRRSLLMPRRSTRGATTPNGAAESVIKDAAASDDDDDDMFGDLDD
eukprot:jgi/Psemu1/283399/fgenesh1_pg.26_\